MARADAAMHSLQVRRHVDASPQDVYQAWTDRSQLARWFRPAPHLETVVHELDLRTGGAYRIEMKDPDGSSYVAIGEYREIEPPTRLSFTWRWEGTPATDTLVTIELAPKNGGTEILLTHTLFESEEQRDGHLEGWNGCLAQLDALFS
jgi:uncharacterized protein YndB with AHSA1/START domain